MKTMMNNTQNVTNQTIEPLKDRKVLNINKPKDKSSDTTKDKQESGNENKNHEKIKNLCLKKKDFTILNALLQSDTIENSDKTKLPQRKFTKLEDYKMFRKTSKNRKKTDEIKEFIENGKVSKLVNKFEMIGKYDMPRENLLVCTNTLRIEEEINTPTTSLSNTIKEKEKIQQQENNVINFSNELKIDVKEKIDKINEKSSLNKKIVKEKKKNEEKSLIKNETKEIIHEEKNNLKKENISFAAKIRNIFSA
ncbi:hypothetical protein TUBRATIS_16450 [Tubulinosema ratisbonensis]|uniref:Uncharacterized protein n=1 Tax=Tubulinosema ratisbonensis TaxID=291195 RepID=A0A437AL06_9MICR|nr:hypothetical protein TUBRATIS_16450 [Tubulinosema ratisbonensis]